MSGKLTAHTSLNPGLAEGNISVASLVTLLGSSSTHCRATLLAGTYELGIFADHGVVIATDSLIVNVFDPLAAPWDNNGVGNVGAFGWATESLGLFTRDVDVNGSGDGIRGNAAASGDRFHFAWAPMNVNSGVRVVARIDAFEGELEDSGRAGVMFRGSTSGSTTSNAFLGLSGAGELVYSNRSGSGGNTSIKVVLSSATLPLWVRLDRRTVNTGGGEKYMGFALASGTGGIGNGTFSSAYAALVRDADVASPIGVLDLGDVDAFIASFFVQGLAADITRPFGVLDLADVDAFIASFLAGCP
ncbi:MAG: GC-type dockerin domain-anchored protein [Planctomycetota bacterium]